MSVRPCEQCGAPIDDPGPATCESCSNPKRMALPPPAGEKPKSQRRVPLVLALGLAMIAPATGLAAYRFGKDASSLRAALECVGTGAVDTRNALVHHPLAVPIVVVEPVRSLPVSTAANLPLSPEDLRELRSLIVESYDKYLKELFQMYSTRTVDEIDAEWVRVDDKGVWVQNLVRKYAKENSGREPELKVEFKKALEHFLFDLHGLILRIERNAKKARADVAAPMFRITNRAKEDFNRFLAQYEAAYGSLRIDERTPLEKLAPTSFPGADADALARLNGAYRSTQAAEQSLRQKGSEAGDLDRMVCERRKSIYLELKAAFEKTGRSFTPSQSPK